MFRSGSRKCEHDRRGSEVERHSGHQLPSEPAQEELAEHQVFAYQDDHGQDTTHLWLILLNNYISKSMLLRPQNLGTDSSRRSRGKREGAFRVDLAPHLDDRLEVGVDHGFFRHYSLSVVVL